MHKWSTNSLLLQNQLRTQGEKLKTIVKILGMEFNTKLILSEMLSVPLFVLLKTNHLQRDGSFAVLLFCDCSDNLQSLEKLTFQGTWVQGITWKELLPPNLVPLWYVTVK
ncbi:hypothetical protein TNIN_431461 [Trichonephila inaurata madagascariensis]|uniref:Uncharacterized protein n=1 Tax=Trichonephila inaurata madagascariensis TaxID=2747483 RepID=A0A8X6WQT5_9ARAC|nr:hypothetical protein TNIN_431461 [Trichonephila inaurata madagascariensis]